MCRSSTSLQSGLFFFVCVTCPWIISACPRVHIPFKYLLALEGPSLIQMSGTYSGCNSICIVSREITISPTHASWSVCHMQIDSTLLTLLRQKIISAETVMHHIVLVTRYQVFFANLNNIFVCDIQRNNNVYMRKTGMGSSEYKTRLLKPQNKETIVKMQNEHLCFLLSSLSLNVNLRIRVAQ